MPAERVFELVCASGERALESEAYGILKRCLADASGTLAFFEQLTGCLVHKAPARGFSSSQAARLLAVLRQILGQVFTLRQSFSKEQDARLRAILAPWVGLCLRTLSTASRAAAREVERALPLLLALDTAQLGSLLAVYFAYPAVPRGAERRCVLLLRRALAAAADRAPGPLLPPLAERLAAGHPHAAKAAGLVGWIALASRRFATAAAPRPVWGALLELALADGTGPDVLGPVAWAVAAVAPHALPSVGASLPLLLAVLGRLLALPRPPPRPAAALVAAFTGATIVATDSGADAGADAGGPAAQGGDPALGSDAADLFFCETQMHALFRLLYALFPFHTLRSLSAACEGPDGAAVLDRLRPCLSAVRLHWRAVDPGAAARELSAARWSAASAEDVAAALASVDADSPAAAAERAAPLSGAAGAGALALRAVRAAAGRGGGVGVRGRDEDDSEDGEGGGDDDDDDADDDAALLVGPDEMPGAAGADGAEPTPRRRRAGRRVKGERRGRRRRHRRAVTRARSPGDGWSPLSACPVCGHSVSPVGRGRDGERGGHTRGVAERGSQSASRERGAVSRHERTAPALRVPARTSDASSSERTAASASVSDSSTSTSVDATPGAHTRTRTRGVRRERGAGAADAGMETPARPTPAARARPAPATAPPAPSTRARSLQTGQRAGAGAGAGAGAESGGGSVAGSAAGSSVGAGSVDALAPRRVLGLPPNHAARARLTVPADDARALWRGRTGDDGRPGPGQRQGQSQSGAGAAGGPDGPASDEGEWASAAETARHRRKHHRRRHGDTSPASEEDTRWGVAIARAAAASDPVAWAAAAEARAAAEAGLRALATARLRTARERAKSLRAAVRERAELAAELGRQFDALQSARRALQAERADAADRRARHDARRVAAARRELALAEAVSVAVGRCAVAEREAAAARAERERWRRAAVAAEAAVSAQAAVVDATRTAAGREGELKEVCCRLRDRVLAWQAYEDSRSAAAQPAAPPAAPPQPHAAPPPHPGHSAPPTPDADKRGTEGMDVEAVLLSHLRATGKKSSGTGPDQAWVAAGTAAEAAVSVALREAGAERARAAEARAAEARALLASERRAWREEAKGLRAAAARAASVREAIEGRLGAAEERVRELEAARGAEGPM